MKHHSAPTCPMVARHAALMAAETRLAEAGAPAEDIAHVAALRAGLERTMRMVDELRAAGHSIEVVEREGAMPLIQAVRAEAPKEQNRTGPVSADVSSPAGQGLAGDGSVADGAAPRGGRASGRPAAPSQPVRKWTDADLQRLTDMAQAQTGYTEMAEALGRTEKACKIMLRRLVDERGMSFPRQPRHQQWTRGDRDRLANMMAAGKKLSEIAAQLGRSEGAVRCFVSRENIERPRKKITAVPKPPATKRSAEPRRPKVAKPKAPRRPKVAKPKAPRRPKVARPKAPPRAEPPKPAIVVPRADGWSDRADRLAVEGLDAGDNPEQVARLIGCSAEDVFLRWLQIFPDGAGAAARAAVLAELRARTGLEAPR
jgi:hypothetical protein